MARIIRLWAMAALATTACWVCADGLAGASWLAPFEPLRKPVAILIAAAWHAAWVTGAASGGATWATVLCWSASAGYATSSVGIGPALLMEGGALLTALSLIPVDGVEGFLQRCRHSRAGITAQLRMGEGWIPWAREAWRLFLRGRPRCTNDPVPLRELAELDDAAARLDRSLKRLAR